MTPWSTDVSADGGQAFEAHLGGTKHQRCASLERKWHQWLEGLDDDGVAGD